MSLSDLARRTSLVEDAAPKTLIWDIETIPAHVSMDVYSQGKRWIGHKDIDRPGGMLCWAASWWSDPATVFYSDLRNPNMLHELWNLLDQASYSVTWNGINFDVPKVRGYFLRAGLAPHRPPKEIDLMRTARTLGFESCALAYVARLLGTPHQKLVEETGGASGWRACLAGDEKAWKLMRRYNTHDVRVTGDLLDILLPWAKIPPIAWHDDDRLCCPRCGSLDFALVGTYQKVVLKSKMYRCDRCGGIFYSGYDSRVSHAHAA